MLRAVFNVVLCSLLLARSAGGQSEQAVPPRSGVGIVQDSKRAVFQLRVKDGAGALVSSGSAFLVSAEGFAITNYHVIEGAHSASAKFGISELEYPVQLWSLDPDHDLALLRLDVAASDFNPVPLSLAEVELLEGEDCWVVGFPTGIGFAATRGIVNRVCDYRALAARFRMADRDPDSRWVQTDATINAGNSGGPLLNSAGAVIGVNTFSIRAELTGVENAYFASHWRHALSLLQARSQPSVGFPAPGARRAVPAAAPMQPPGRTVPDIDWPTFERVKEGNPLAIPAAFARFRNAVKCSSCHGDGKVIERVQTGTTTRNGMRFPIHADRLAPCSACKGSGAAPDARIEVAALKVAEALVNVRPDDRVLEEQLQKARAIFLEARSRAPERVDNALNVRARQILQPRRGERGQIVLFVGGAGHNSVEANRQVELAGLQHGGRVLGCALVEPLRCGGDSSGATLIGGVLAGYVKVGETELAVLQDGFIIGP